MSTFIHYITHHRTSIAICGTLIIFGGGVGWITPELLLDTYEVSQTLEIQQIRDTSNEYYSYDGFYAIQAEELMSENVAQWFINPEFVEKIITESDPETAEGLSIRDFRTLFLAERLSATLVEVRFEVGNLEDGQNRAEAIDQVIQNRLIARDLEGYRIKASKAVIRPKAYTQLFWSLGGGILGIIVACIGMVLTISKK